jgi:hypothetical protein
MLLASLFVFVVLSPLMIHVGLNLAERIAMRREALNPGKRKDPRSAWASDASAPAVSSAAPSAR